MFEGKEKGHYIGMFDYGDVIAYILLVLHRKPGQKGNDDSIDPESFEIKDIVHRALQGQKVPVGMASGNVYLHNVATRKENSMGIHLQIYRAKTHSTLSFKKPPYCQL